MVPTTVECAYCGAPLEVKTNRKFVLCHYCGMKTPFEGFEYKYIDWRNSIYAAIKLWTDCPACDSPNMYLGAERRGWRCPDCGYIWTEKERRHGVLWYCDECDAYLNVQEGFSTKRKAWKCTECGYVNGLTRKDIL